jgi:regulatory protein
MTSSDHEYLAPVINLFGDRSGTKQTETTASLEESSAPPITARLSVVDDTALRGSAVDGSAVDDSAVDDSAVDDSAVDDSAVDNRTRPQENEPAQVVSVRAHSKAERRNARDGFSEISRVSMRALARRGMSSHEMTQFLTTREFESGEIDGEIERLEGSGLLDDGALAEVLVRTLRDRKGLGASAIRAELRRRKIDPDYISAVLDDGRDDEQERATEIALKRAPQLRSLDGVTAKRRLTGFLMRKGYSGSIVSAAVATALASNSGETTGGPVFR